MTLNERQTNREVFEAFANRQPAQGGSVHVERTHSAVVLYSYTTPVAFLADDDQYPVFTQRYFSATTAKQKAQAKRAFSGVSEMPDHIFREFAKKAGANFSLAR